MARGPLPAPAGQILAAQFCPDPGTVGRGPRTLDVPYEPAPVARHRLGLGRVPFESLLCHYRVDGKGIAPGSGPGHGLRRQTIERTGYGLQVEPGASRQNDPRRFHLRMSRS